MHYLPTDLIAAFIGVYAALHGLSILLSYLNTAERHIEGRATWVARDGTAFEEFAVAEIESSNILKRDFEESSSEAIFARSVSRSNA